MSQEAVDFRLRQARSRVAIEVGEHLVVVGFGPVAARLVDDLLPLVARKLLRITVLGAEAHVAYNRVLVGEYAVGRVTRQALAAVDMDAWRRAGVEVHTDSTVTRVDRSARRVHWSGPRTGQCQTAWDRLVFATGALALRPNLRGIDPSPDGAALPERVMSLRSVEDAESMQPVIAAGGHVVVLGGGVLGVEAALAAAETTGRATLVHTGAGPLERATSAETAVLLQQRLAQAGVRCIRERAVAVQTDSQGGFKALEVTHRCPVRGDLLVLSCGVKARTELAEGAGLRTAHGIVVDHELQADVEGRVFAIGDCAQVLCRDPGCEPCVRGPVSGAPSSPAGLIGPGWRQAEYLAGRIGAEILAQTPSGTPPALLEPMPPAESSILRLKSKDIDLVVLTAGQPAAAASAARLRFTDETQAQDLLVELAPDRTLSRAVSLGRPRAIAHLSAALASEEPLLGDLTYLLSLDSDWATPQAGSPSQVVACRCAGVSRETIETAMDDGAETVEQVSAATRACTGCRTCAPEIQALLSERALRLADAGPEAVLADR